MDNDDRDGGAASELSVYEMHQVRKVARALIHKRGYAWPLGRNRGRILLAAGLLAYRWETGSPGDDFDDL
jgi:hypothetical protein